MRSRREVSVGAVRTVGVEEEFLVFDADRPLLRCSGPSVMAYGLRRVQSWKHCSIMWTSSRSTRLPD